MTQSAESMIADLVRQTETVLRRMRELITVAEGAGDIVTAEFLTERIARYEKDARLLRAKLRQ